MADLIERQAAIDNLKRHLNETDVPDHYPGIFNAIEEWLSDWEAPSAQPEIVRCKDCKYRDAEDGFCEGRGWPMQLVPDDGFCNKGKRSEG